MRLRPRAKVGLAVYVTYVIVLALTIYGSEDLVLAHLGFAIGPAIPFIFNWRNLFEVSNG